jgi:hypothetical protein
MDLPKGFSVGDINKKHVLKQASRARIEQVPDGRPEVHRVYPEPEQHVSPLEGVVCFGV